MDPYSLGNHVIEVGGAAEEGGINRILKSTIGANYMLTAAIIIVLVIIIIVLAYKSMSKDGFGTSGPTSMARYVTQSLSGSDALKMPSSDECAASLANPATTGAWGWMNQIAHTDQAATIDPALMASGESGSYASSTNYHEGMASHKAANTDKALIAISQGY